HLLSVPLENFSTSSPRTVRPRPTGKSDSVSRSPGFHERLVFNQVKARVEYLNPHASISLSACGRRSPLVHTNRWQPLGAANSFTGSAASSSNDIVLEWRSLSRRLLGFCDWIAV